MVGKERYIKIKTNDNRVEAWGYLTGKTLSLYIGVKPLVNEIPLTKATKIISETGGFQVNNIKVRLR